MVGERQEVRGYRLGSSSKSSALSIPPKLSGHLGMSLNFTIKIDVDPYLGHKFLISKLVDDL